LKKANKRVAERVAREVKRLGREKLPEGVQSLNPGFFLMQRIRAQGAPKQKSVVRAQLRAPR